VPENRSSPRVVRGKLKINYRLKNKTWTNLQIKNHKMSHELELIRPRGGGGPHTHTFKILTPPTPSVEKIVNLDGFKYV